MKIHPVGAEFFHADGKTDRTKLIVAFRNVTKSAWEEQTDVLSTYKGSFFFCFVKIAL